MAVSEAMRGTIRKKKKRKLRGVEGAPRGPWPHAGNVPQRKRADLPGPDQQDRQRPMPPPRTQSYEDLFKEYKRRVRRKKKSYLV